MNEPTRLLYSTVCRAKNPQGPYVDRDGKACAGKKDGGTNESGTVILASHSTDKQNKYQVLAPGSVGIVVRLHALFLFFPHPAYFMTTPLSSNLRR